MEKWTLTDASKLLKALAPEASKYGYHVTLGGSVVVDGAGRDLDLYFHPLQGSVLTLMDDLTGYLEKIWGPAQKMEKWPSVRPGERAYDWFARAQREPAAAPGMAVGAGEAGAAGGEGVARFLRDHQPPPPPPAIPDNWLVDPPPAPNASQDVEPEGWRAWRSFQFGPAAQTQSGGVLLGVEGGGSTATAPITGTSIPASSQSSPSPSFTYSKKLRYQRGGEDQIDVFII